MITEKEVKDLCRTALGLHMISVGRLPDPYRYSSRGIRQHGAQTAGAIVTLVVIWLVFRAGLAPQMLCFICGMIGLVYAGYNLFCLLSETMSRRAAYRAWHGMVELKHLLMRHKLDSEFTASVSREEIQKVFREWREQHRQDTRTRAKIKADFGDHFEVLVQELFPPR